MRLISLLGDKSTNIDATNEYKDQNSPYKSDRRELIITHTGAASSSSDSFNLGVLNF